jgi:hypothetical protein
VQGCVVGPGLDSDIALSQPITHKYFLGIRQSISE